MASPVASTGFTAGQPAMVGFQSGTVTAWAEATGCGVIVASDGVTQVLVHRSALTDGRSLVVGALVTFELGFDPVTRQPVANLCVGAVDGPAPTAGEDAALATSAADVTLHQALVSDVAVAGALQPDQGAALAMSPRRPPPPPPPPVRHMEELLAAHASASSSSTAAVVAAMAGAGAGMEYVVMPMQCMNGGVQAQVSDNIFVAGLPLDTTAESVKTIFGPYGEVISVRVLPHNGKPDRAALIRLGDPSQASWLVENLHQNIPIGLTTPITVKFANKPVVTTPIGAMQQGIVKAWMEKRGMGFIASPDGGPDLFVHRSDLSDGHSLVKGSTVTFEPSIDTQRGKPVAKKVSGAVPNPAAVGGADAAVLQQQQLQQQFLQQQLQQQQQLLPQQLSSEPNRRDGVIKVWFDQKGYGFVAPNDGSSDAFFHRTWMLDPSQQPVVGAVVTYLADFDQVKNRSLAKQVALGAAPAAVAPAALDWQQQQQMQQLQPLPPQHPHPMQQLQPQHSPLAAPVISAGMEETKTGTVKVWFEEKSFGFIAPDEGGADLFVHRRDLTDGSMLIPGARVTYEAAFNMDRGKPTAAKVTGASYGGATAVNGVASVGVGVGSTYPGTHAVYAGGHPSPPPPRPPTPGRPAAQVVASPQAPALFDEPRTVPPPNAASLPTAVDEVIVSGLPDGADVEFIRGIFEPYGDILQLDMVPGMVIGAAATMRMGSAEQAQWLVDNLNGNLPVGLEKPIYVGFARDTAPSRPAPFARSSPY